MSSLRECYDILGVGFGVGMADLTSSYKNLCRIYHPDISGAPDCEEKMKRINTAYSTLREKLILEAKMRERLNYQRQQRRYSYDTSNNKASSRSVNNSAEETKAARSVLGDYFNAINTFDYVGAYSLLSNIDKRIITLEEFVKWRESVARLYPMNGYDISEGASSANLVYSGAKKIPVRRFSVTVKEENLTGEDTQPEAVEKLVVYENGIWRVFLGYRNIMELTRGFDEQFENKRRYSADKALEDYYSEHHQQYDMLNLAGLRKAASSEIYRQSRFGGMLTFAVISSMVRGGKRTVTEPLVSSAARTIAGSLREIDVAAYTGDGVFAVLFVGLRKKNAEEIIKRLLGRIRKNAGAYLGGQADIKCSFESWAGAGSCTISGINEVLRGYGKKM